MDALEALAKHLDNQVARSEFEKLTGYSGHPEDGVLWLEQNREVLKRDAERRRGGSGVVPKWPAICRSSDQAAEREESGWSRRWRGLRDTAMRRHAEAAESTPGGSSCPATPSGPRRAHCRRKVLHPWHRCFATSWRAMPRRGVRMWTQPRERTQTDWGEYPRLRLRGESKSQANRMADGVRRSACGLPALTAG